MVGYRQGSYRSSALARKIIPYLVSKRDIKEIPRTVTRRMSVRRSVFLNSALATLINS